MDGHPQPGGAGQGEATAASPRAPCQGGGKSEARTLPLHWLSPGWEVHALEGGRCVGGEGACRSREGS